MLLKCPKTERINSFSLFIGERSSLVGIRIADCLVNGVPNDFEGKRVFCVFFLQIELNNYFPKYIHVAKLRTNPAHAEVSI